VPSRHLIVLISTALVLATGCGDESSSLTPDAGPDLGGDAPADAGSPDITGDAGMQPVVIESGNLSLRVEVDPFAIEIRNSVGEVVLETASVPVHLEDDHATNAYGAPAATTDRGSFAAPEIWGWDTYTNDPDSWTRFDRALSIQNDLGVVEVVLGSSDSDAQLELTISGEGNRLDVVLAIDDEHADDFDWLGQTFILGTEERFYGLGGRLTSVEHRGQSLYTWVERSGVGQGEGHDPGASNPSPNGEAMNAFPVPFLLSSAGYGLLLDSDGRSQFHLGSQTPGFWRVEVGSSELRYSLFVNADPANTVRELSQVNGAPHLPAEWVFGPRRRLDPTTTVSDMPEWHALREFGIATTAIEDSGQPFPSNRPGELDAELRAQSADLADWGYRRIGRFSPLLSSTASEMERDFRQAREGGHLAAADDGSAYLITRATGEAPEFAIIDVSTRAGARWLDNIVSKATDLGYVGWRIEDTELVPWDAQFADGSTGETLHNTYPVAIQETLFDALERDLPGDHFVGADAGYSGSASFADMVWVGASNTTFEDADGLPSVLRAGINLGLSGVPFFGVEVGGADGSAGALDEELFLRWAAFAAFAPGMQSGLPGDAERWTVWRDDETLAAFAEFSSTHTRLAPYLHLTAQAAVDTGLPMMRHPLLVAPDDADALSVDDAYFLGDALYVAPVIERGATSRSVYLPAGHYVDWSTGARLDGAQTVEVLSPVGEIPVFLVEGGIVPMYDAVIDTLVDESRDDVTGPSDVADLLDVLTVMGEGDAASSLTDGTSLAVTRSDEAVAGPFWNGTTELIEAESLSAVADCDGCFYWDDAIAGRLWVTTPLAENVEIVATGLSLSATGPAGVPRRVRWRVDLID